MHVSFEHCGESERLQPGERHIRRLHISHGPLRCKQCDAFIPAIDVAGAQSWIEAQVTRKRELARLGQLATRKQSTRKSDEDIDRDGLSAELAACALLCPGALDAWRKAAEAARGNRGRDLLRHWTGLNKPVEVKHTRYQDQQRGFLLVRPPRQTPGRMREVYIDDAYYVLMVGAPYQHKIAGWTNRQGLIHDGELNPVPIRQEQRESWGMHWSKLRPIDELVARVATGGSFAALWRWIADQCC